jgi:flagellin
MVRVNTNQQSVFAQRSLAISNRTLGREIEKISTGKKINRAADDAAGLSISQKLEAKIRGNEQAKKNIGDGISLLQTGEGGLAQVQDNLQRIREIMVQAQNGTNSTNELDAMQREINARVTAIEDIAQSTTFNGRQVLLGNFFNFGGVDTYYGDSFNLQTGADNGNTTEVNTFGFGTLLGNLTGGVVVDINWDQSGILSSFEGGQLVEGSSTSLAAFRITGATVASQNGTNADAGDLDDLDAMIDNTSRMRSKFGALQNGLESKLEYLDVSIENSKAAKSRIEDADIAKSSSEFLRQNILQNSAAVMLTQANSSAEIVLNLLP